MTVRTLLMAMALPLAVAANGQSGMSSLAQAEVQRRATSVTEARQLTENGDKAYNAARYKEAAAAYRGALELLPDNAPMLAEERKAVVQRLVQASVEVAKELRRQGDLEGANAAVNAVLVEGIAPDSIEAKAMSEQLSDPIRTNPALTPEHAQNIDKVRQALYRAQGAYDLGKFDEAMVSYEDVLRIDPYNSAARRGMERTAAAKSSYYQAAYDQTRAEMLSMVDREWEMPVPPAGDLDQVAFELDNPTIDYTDKLRRMIVPVVALDSVTLPEAVDFVRQRSIELDTFETDPMRKGVNVVLDLSNIDPAAASELREKPFSLQFRNVPLKQVIDYICEATGTVAIEQPFALVIRSAGSDSLDMITKTYRVPPDFLTSGETGGSDTSEAGGFDPFEEEADTGSLPVRLTAEEVLKSRGVSFPEGASASFNASNSTLRVRNTFNNQDLVSQIVDMLANQEPTLIVVEAKMIRTTEQRLEELSFDWLLGEFGMSGDSYISGGTVGNQRLNSDLDVPLQGAVSAFPVTAGNRSGDGAISTSSLNDLIRAGGRLSGSETVARAPGALWLNGTFSDSQVSLLIRALDQKKGIDIAAVPTVTTRSGQQASVRTVREFIYPTEYEPPELPNRVGFVGIGGGNFDDDDDFLVGNNDSPGFPVTPATPTSFEMREVGVILEVLPTASQNKKYVDLVLKPSITDFDGFINYGSPITTAAPAPIFSPEDILLGTGATQVTITPNEILMPVFSKVGTETSVTVADQSTLVIGGLLDERIQTVEDKTPILGDIPIAGRLFQSRASRPVKTAIVLLVKVRVVDAAGRSFNQ